MGSKHALSNGNEPEEVTDLIAAFEQQNKCKLMLSCCLRLRNGYLDTQWEVTLMEEPPTEQAQKHSDYPSVSVWGGDFKTLMGLLTRLLYAMDFQLAVDEFKKVEKQKA